MKHQNKTVEMRKIRQLKDATTFIIRDRYEKYDKEKSVDSERRSITKKSEKKFMIAPH